MYARKWVKAIIQSLHIFKQATFRRGFLQQQQKLEFNDREPETTTFSWVADQLANILRDLFQNVQNLGNF